MITHLFSSPGEAATYLHCGGSTIVCDMGVQEMLPDQGVVHGPQSDLTVIEICGDYTLTRR